MTALSHQLTCTTPGHPGQWFGILLLAVAGLAVPAESRAQNEGDRAALVALYNATDGENWTNNTNWNSSLPISRWYGVVAAGASSAYRVLSLQLGNNNLTGSIPPELGRLSTLTGLYLNNNNLTGSIPPELGNLSSFFLERLWLYDNNLTGSIPPALGRLSKLTDLRLHNNSLTGSIPPELASLHLLVLDLGTNNLTGSIPTALGLGNLFNLEDLRVADNSLTGPLPSSMTNLQRLDTLFIENNDGLCAPADAEFQEWLATVGDFKGDTCAEQPEDAVQPKAPDEVQENVDAAVAAAGGLRAGGPPVTIDMSTLFSFGDGGSADTTFTARSSQPALVTAETTDGQLVLTPQPAAATANLVGGAADGDPEPVTITVTATRADDTAEVEFTVEVESEPEPVPVLPLLGQLLLALGLLAGGVRQARHWAR